MTYKIDERSIINEKNIFGQNISFETDHPKVFKGLTSVLCLYNNVANDVQTDLEVIINYEKL